MLSGKKTSREDMEEFMGIIKPIFYSDKSLALGNQRLMRSRTGRWHYISYLPANSRQ
jgi:hypothetical protein